MAPAHARLERSTIVALAAMALAVFVIANDVTALSVALPAVESDFDADVGTAQWVISAYALIFGVLIVPGGRLADLFGRRRIFFAGAAIFAVLSLLGALAPDAWVLIACRALMGIGGALMWPATLGMTYSILPAERAALAGGLIIGSAGFGSAAGRSSAASSPTGSAGAGSSSSTSRSPISRVSSPGARCPSRAGTTSSGAWTTWAWRRSRSASSRCSWHSTRSTTTAGRRRGSSRSWQSSPR